MKVIRRTMSPKLDPEGHRVARYRPDLVPPGITDEAFEGEPSGVPSYLVGKGMVAKVEITSQGLVIIEGRPHPSLAWIEIARFTATEERVIPALTELRAIVRDNTGAVSVSATLPATI